MAQLNQKINIGQEKKLSLTRLMPHKNMRWLRTPSPAKYKNSWKSDLAASTGHLAGGYIHA
jgi:hypothetical protein